MTGIATKDYRAIVEDELAGKATPEEIELLEDDPEKWRAMLGQMRTELDQEALAERARLRSRGVGIRSPAWLDLQARAHLAGLELTKRQKRAKELKAEVQKLSEPDAKQQFEIGAYIDEEVLSELQSIRGLLERLVVKAGA
jgi:hypothetical protein